MQKKQRINEKLKQENRKRQEKELVKKEEEEAEGYVVMKPLGHNLRRLRSIRECWSA